MDNLAMETVIIYMVFTKILEPNSIKRVSTLIEFTKILELILIKKAIIYMDMI